MHQLHHGETHSEEGETGHFMSLITANITVFAEVY